MLEVGVSSARRLKDAVDRSREQRAGGLTVASAFDLPMSRARTIGSATKGFSVSRALKYGLVDNVPEEQQRLNMHFTDAYTYQPRLHIYNNSLTLADTVITTFPTSYETYFVANKSYEVRRQREYIAEGFRKAAD